MTEIVKIYRDIPVRIIERDGELWFPFKDLCRVLRCENSSKNSKRLMRMKLIPSV